MWSKNIKKVIENPKIILEKVLYSRIGRIIPTEYYLKSQYKLKFCKNIDIINPRTYAEKIQYLKINNVNSNLDRFVDKYEVRNYISKVIGEKYLIPLIGVYDNVEEIDFDSLPQKFVLKCTHDSQSVILCWDKAKLDIDYVINQLSKSIKKNAYFYSREYFYRNLPRRIICEEIIGDGISAPNDYKFMCFNGKVELIIIDHNRFTNHTRSFYSINWEKVHIETDCPESQYEVKPPKLLNEMIEISEKLSKGYNHVRVDLYCVNNRIYFGELTFMPWAGLIEFKPKEWNYKLGMLIDI